MLAKRFGQFVLLCALAPGLAVADSIEPVQVLPPPSNAQASETPLFAPPAELLSLPPIGEAVLEEPDSEVLETEDQVTVVPSQWYHPSYWFGPTPWDVGVELGLNGNEGINEAFSLRTGGHIRRKTDRWKLDSSLVYNRNNANNVETQNNALLDLRMDRLFKDSPWTLFFIHQTLYDEFQAFDVRVSVNGGLGYECDCSEVIDLIARIGAGTSREFGGPDNQYAPEALMGLEYAHQLTKMQRLAAKLDYYPQWDDFSSYRIVLDTGWEIDLDQPKNLSLKFSVVDRYDSTPNGVQPNEINYSALLIWGL